MINDGERIQFVLPTTIAPRYSSPSASSSSGGIVPPGSTTSKYVQSAPYTIAFFSSISSLPIASITSPSWPIQIFYGKTNEHFIRTSPALAPLIASRRILLTELKSEVNDNFGIRTNELFTNASFWYQIQGDKVLFFQIDSIMCSNSPHKVTDYLHYDYIGAPWDAKLFGGLKGSPVGNGGFSLRSRSKTLQLLQMIKWDGEPEPVAEDVWYAINLRRYLNASIAPVEVAKTFAVESVFYERPLGVHKLVLFRRDRLRLYETCPEARLVPPFSSWF